MSNVTAKKTWGKKKLKLKNLQKTIVVGAIDDQKLLRNQSNRHFPQLNDRSMINLVTIVMVMPIQQYSQ